MSHSPASIAGNESAYHKSWADIYKLVEAGGSWSGRERNCCFLNTDRNYFTDISAVSGLDHIDDGRGVAAVDWDFDGDLDLWLANRTGPRVRFMRNDQRSGNHFLAVLLEGRAGNRDAIGARLELTLVGPEPRKLIRTVQAGDAFVSQSTKWKHFGVGNANEVASLVIRWPGGAVERFDKLELDRWYRIVEGVGKLESWQPPRRDSTWTPAAPQQTTVDGTKTVLLHRVPLPTLNYTDLEGKFRPLEQSDSPSQPTLINLWATWCLPCAAELQEFASHRAQLEQQGLRVVALSVDGLVNTSSDADPGTSQLSDAALSKFLERVGARGLFASGRANRTLVDKLDVLHDAVHAFGVEYDQSMSFPTPASFLVDAAGRLAVIYKGRVAVSELLDDVAALAAAPAETHSASVPFAGRWYREPADVTNVFVRFAERFNRRGYLDEGREYLALAADLWDRHSDHSGLQPRLAFMYNFIGESYLERKRYGDAVHCFDEALRHDPAAVQARANLGTVYLQQGKLDEAAEHYAAAKQMKPDFLPAHLNLGIIALQRGEFAAAETHFRDCLQVDASLALAHNLLGMALANQGDRAQAQQHFREAIRLDPNLGEARRNLELLESTTRPGS